MTMDRIIELQETKLAIAGWIRKLANDAKAIGGRAKKEGRELTSDEQGSIDAIYAQHAESGLELDAVEAEITSLDTSDSRGRVVKPGPIGDRLSSAIHIPKSARFADLFGAVGNDPYAGRFAGLGEFCLAVASGKTDSRLIVNTSVTEESGVSAGFLLPQQFLARILDGALDQEVIRPNATVLPMAGKTLDAPGFDYQDGTSGKRAGLQLQWGPEATALNEQLPKARTLGFSAKKGSILCRVGSELAEDAPAFDRQLSTAMTQAVASGLDGAFLSSAGTGVGIPLSILNSPCLITVTKESGQAASTLFLQNLANMLARLTPSAYKRSSWLVHPTVLPSLLQLTVIVKNVGGSENVGGGLAAAVVQGADGVLRIFGRPVAVTDACSAFSSAGDVVLADLSQYAIAMRRDARIELSRDAYFASDEIGFKLTLRLDGMPTASAPTKLRDGTNTVSPFIALGAR